MTSVSEEKRRLIDEIIALGVNESYGTEPVLPDEWFSLDLTMSQLKVLLCLHAHGPSRVSEVAAAISVSLAVTTGVIDRLVHRGMVVRGGDPTDRRVVICSLSDEGKVLAGRLWESSIERGRRLLEVMTVDELLLVREAVAVVFRVLQRVRGKLGMSSAEPAPCGTEET